MRLVLENVQGQMKPARRGFGNQYLVEHEDGHREYVPANEVTEHIENFNNNKYSQPKPYRR